MNKTVLSLTGLLGLLAIAWVASGYLGSGPLALAVTLLIAAAYAAGVLELLRYHTQTQGLQQALEQLSTTPADDAALASWLQGVPAALRSTVAQRVQGVRAALPGPSLTPMLAGLLVLLGMLGTFAGMVATLQGTGIALKEAVDVQSMRELLAAPVRGLGLAFGTSVAGVAGSAVLGLMSALCRRSRQHTGLLLDSHTASTLLPFTLAQRLQRQQAAEEAAATQAREQAQEARLQQQLAVLQQQHQSLLQVQQQQHEANRQQRQQQLEQLPQTVHALQQLMAQLQEQTRTGSQQILASQQAFQSQTEQAYGTLATSVAHSLQQTLSAGTQAQGQQLHSAVQTTMDGLAQQGQQLQSQVASSLQQQMEQISQRFEAQSATWVQTVGQQLQAQQAALLRSLDDSLTRQQAQQASQDRAHQASVAAAWAGMTSQLEAHSRRSTAQTEALSERTLTEVTRLVQAATEAPRAAAQAMAEVVNELLDKLSASLVRDNSTLQERERILSTMNELVGSVQATTAQQQAAIQGLVDNAATWLQDVGQRHTRQAQAEAQRLDEVSAQLSTSAAEVASLGEALGVAVGEFAQSNSQMLAQLHSLETALAQVNTRSNEQLAYYVAQAREVIDLSLLAQKQVVDSLQRVAASPAKA